MLREIHRSAVSGARVCEVELASGKKIFTPCFVPVGTNTLLKTVPPRLVGDVHSSLVFFNTYHSIVQPGLEVIGRMGGLHAFFRCEDRPLITDSGGFQAFSLARTDENVGSELKGNTKRRFSDSPSMRGRVTEEGISFKSYVDGSKFLLSPESSVESQQILGADIILPLDELLPMNVSAKRLLRSMDRTHRWEKRSVERHLKGGAAKPQNMFAILHGGVDLELRKQSLDTLLSFGGFDGIAIGGSLGRTREEMFDVLRQEFPCLLVFDFFSKRKLSLPPQLPRHLLGIGDPVSLLQVIQCGMDTFDSAYPSRLGRHLTVFVESEDGISATTSRISHKKWALETGPISKGCKCYTCTNHSAALVHHLARIHDSASGTLCTIHNVSMMHSLVENIRKLILQDRV